MMKTLKSITIAALTIAALAPITTPADAGVLTPCEIAEGQMPHLYRMQRMHVEHVKQARLPYVAAVHAIASEPNSTGIGRWGVPTDVHENDFRRAKLIYNQDLLSYIRETRLIIMKWEEALDQCPALNPKYRAPLEKLVASTDKLEGRVADGSALKLGTRPASNTRPVTAKDRGEEEATCCTLPPSEGYQLPRASEEPTN